MPARYDLATTHLDPPFAVVDSAAFDANAAAMLQRAGGKPIRVASKSVRCRPLIQRALALPGYAGVMAFTLAEALWLAETGTSDDILVAYPTADRGGLADLVKYTDKVTLMVDDPAQLDLIDAAVAPTHRPDFRLCLELDASWRPFGAHIGVRRSPLHSPTALGEFAGLIAGRRGFTLVGVMGYEAQIAGLGDAQPGRRAYSRMVRFIQRRSAAELAERRAAAVAAVRRHGELEFVNGGGTGSLHLTAAEDAVTELTAGSGLFGPTLFDGYSAWQPRPAALFALSVVRRPAPGIATVLGGGWVASGPAHGSRLPSPYLPAGLKLNSSEGAGEVQTPLLGPGADALRVGDRVWFRHAKAGELCEHVNELHLVTGDQVVDVLPTYRGEGKAFL
ncbi:alanine racemase [Longispora fulva]|uniref:D-serine deaminase-like pyridoxal phosphate-dependent protein n=1 Tax=Longispora fulva TaxID=619741 RepID=A0A8J7GM13_9ACTN|nr:amino acid deaminase/aldolase [Longispora fulva]MBG6139298.1 D-serine deaminase-like pyridoxal phosphate-dependent protein [Longispora fulva]GIG58793.1 alanine racemase [Longispora fulva]